MVVDIRIRKILHIQYDEVHLGKMAENLLECWDVLWCIYRGSTFYACIDYQELRLLSSDEELTEYINNKSVHEWIDAMDMVRLSELFDMHKDIVTILLERPTILMDEILTINRIQIACNSNYIDFSIYMTLKQKGIRTCIVNFPSKINSVYGSFCLMSMTEQWLKDPYIQKMVVQDMKKITDLAYEDYSAQVLETLIDRNQEIQIGEGERTIYLVGPCIAVGYSPSEVTLAEILSCFLRKLDYSYKIIKIDNRNFPNKIMEYNICQNDIVLFLGTSLNYKDYDLTEVLENYDGPKSLCTNDIMHMSRVGCELVADAIVNDVIETHNKTSEEMNNNKVLYYSEPEQLQFEVEYEIKMYLKRTGICCYLRKGNNGAIVMNANPFTIGHRKLVEYAADKVDKLFVFVVEEDASFFTFEERRHMVLQGTSDIENVIVLDSGDFVISNKTFYDYFTKETDNKKIIDASKDIFIFARYIAPYFNICKRFVGDEPSDEITKQYNLQMQKILPRYGCEVIEIPRFEKDREVVSGSMVRKALINKNIEYLQRMLPVSSFFYIEKRLEELQHRKVMGRREAKVHVCMTDRLQRIWELIEFINRERYVAIYGIGKDTQVILKLLHEEKRKQLIFVDKKAETSKLLFMERKVHPPCELKKLSLKYYIIILSSRFYKEMYNECIKQKVQKNRIKYNPYNLYLFPNLDI